MMVLKIGLLVLALCLVAFQAYVRFAPTDPTFWRVDAFEASAPKGNGARVVIVTSLPPQDAYARLISAAEAAARTTRVDASAASDATLSATYVTRTAFWGFPDFTTIAVRPHAQGAEVVLFGLARFGGSDFGVNAARIATWLKEADL